MGLEILLDRSARWAQQFLEFPEHPGGPECLDSLEHLLGPMGRRHLMHRLLLWHQLDLYHPLVPLGLLPQLHLQIPLDR